MHTRATETEIEREMAIKREKKSSKAPSGDRCLAEARERARAAHSCVMSVHPLQKSDGSVIGIDVS